MDRVFALDCVVWKAMIQYNLDESNGHISDSKTMSTFPHTHIRSDKWHNCQPRVVPKVAHLLFPFDDSDPKAVMVMVLLPMEVSTYRHYHGRYHHHYHASWGRPNLVGIESFCIPPNVSTAFSFVVFCPTHKRLVCTVLEARPHTEGRCLKSPLATKEVKFQRASANAFLTKVGKHYWNWNWNLPRQSHLAHRGSDDSCLLETRRPKILRWWYLVAAIIQLTTRRLDE